MLTELEVKEFNFEPEYAEIARASKPIFTGYPQSIRMYRLVAEAYNISIEEPYFWTLEYIREMGGFPEIIKITDVFSAAENSSFFGSAQQRLGLQQDKVSQFLATIGKMVKELFQLVRELRILDERLGYYADSLDPLSKSRGSADITLKGIWVDMVEQGAKNPASVYGMAREVQFITLPDLFFNIHPLKQEDVDVAVETEAGQFNKKVREVLKRKLRSYLGWKEHTYDELKNRRIFTLKYLRQHYEIIKMYMTWVKPYLKNIERLTMDTSKMDSPDLLNAFETSMIETEFLAKKPAGRVNQCFLVHFMYRTRPDMNYTQEYQRGPIHVGKVEITFRGYVWTDEEIVRYQQMRAREDFKLLGVVDGSVKAAMESLGDELMRYLEEAGEDGAKKPEMQGKKIQAEGKKHTRGWKSIREMLDKPQKKKSARQESWLKEKDELKATEAIKRHVWRTYHHFKKHHDMLNW